MTRVAVHGAGGRMGMAVLRALTEEPGVSVGAAVDHPGAACLGRDIGTLLGGEPAGIIVESDVARAIGEVDVVIDFSLPRAMPSLMEACTAAHRALVVGTTGFGPELNPALERLAEVAPLVVAPNMSAGVNILFYLAREAVRLAGAAFDAEIVEMHHRHKVDAPSGTAVRLADVVAGAKGLDRESLVYGRQGATGPRKADEIAVMTLRGGDVVGDHTLVLAGPGERIELTHRATDRSIFARGAVRAAAWAVQQPPGRYGMADVLGL